MCTYRSILSAVLSRTDCAWSKDTRLFDVRFLCRLIALCLISDNLTTNRVFGVVSPRSRYMRELEARLMQEQRVGGIVSACARAGMRYREARELIEENMPAGREVRRLSLRTLDAQ